VFAIDWSAAAIPLSALIIATAGLLVTTIGRQKDRNASADLVYVQQLEKRLDAEVKRNDRLEEDLSSQNLRLLACEEARRSILEDNARLMYFKVFGKDLPEGGPVAAPD